MVGVEVRVTTPYYNATVCADIMVKVDHICGARVERDGVMRVREDDREHIHDDDEIKKKRRAEEVSNHTRNPLQNRD